MVGKKDGNLRNEKSFHSFAASMSTEIDNKERILLQATELFKRYGVRSVSMDDIAGQLGMSKKTIYQYYADKDELVSAVVAAEIQVNETCCIRDSSYADNAVHEIFLAMDMVVELFRTMNPSLLFDLQKYHPQAFQKFLAHKNDFVYRKIYDNLLRGIKEELYRDDINSTLLAQYRVESMMLIFNPAFQSTVKLNLAEIDEEITLHFLYGVVNAKGYKLILKYKQERTKKHQHDAKVK